MQTVVIPCTRYRDARAVRQAIERVCSVTWCSYAGEKTFRGYNDASQEPCFLVSWDVDEDDLDGNGYPTLDAALREASRRARAVA